ncbi:ParB N-terminal domain-containing protein [Pedobacter sp. P26]|uniref:ParB N-terminal domain-containing protein n=1 Tax=Pedobacter sp. P26 TaxID=3423956 RepID=UPI003D67B3DC
MKKNIEIINPATLSFDHRNPRIAEFSIGETTPEKDIIKILWNAMGVEEIVLSIKASGFFDNEPLIAVKENGKNVVIEGNRRLAAVKALINPQLADFIGINKNLLSIPIELRNELDSLPVIFVDDRKEAWKFIGFKHINGPAKWGSYAKAQYISQIKNEYHISLEEIASQIGDTHKTVQKLYQGLQVIEQAEKKGRFDRDDIKANRLYFSHLYTGLTYDGFKDFLGLRNVSEEVENPVPVDKEDNLEELLIWLFGSNKSEREPVIVSQNPDLRRLEAVIRDKEATYALRDGVSLIQAYEISQPKSETFEQSLLEAKRALQKAQSFYTEGFDGKDEGILKQAGTIANIAEELYDAMLKKWQSNQGPDAKKKREFSED